MMMGGACLGPGPRGLKTDMTSKVYVIRPYIHYYLRLSIIVIVLDATESYHFQYCVKKKYKFVCLSFENQEILYFHILRTVR